jgi:hypothetical protein
MAIQTLKRPAGPLVDLNPDFIDPYPPPRDGVRDGSSADSVPWKSLEARNISPQPHIPRTLGDISIEQF